MSNIIDELELSVRTSNVLKLMGDVHTLDDFMALRMGRVCAVRGAGRRTWNEIREVQEHFRRLAEEADRPKPWSERDEIAMHVLPSVIKICKGDMRKEGETSEQMFARKAYAIADAMIAARKTTKAKG